MFLFDVHYSVVTSTSDSGLQGSNLGEALLLPTDALRLTQSTFVFSAPQFTKKNIAFCIRPFVFLVRATCV